MGENSTRPARGHWMRGGVRGRGLWLAALTVLSLLVLALPAVAQADDIWKGASTISPKWSDTANWVGAVAPSNPAGTLTFPDLSSCTSPVACYASNNDLTGISATGLVFSNTTGVGYRILGNGLTVGAGGITDASGGLTSTTINAPLTLSAAQSWTIGMGPGNAYNSVSLAPTATVGGSFPLSVAFPATSRGDLFVNSDMEVGAVTVTGVGGLHVRSAGNTGAVNGTNGQPVKISSGATLVANPGATVGALSVSGTPGAKLQLGTGTTNTGTTTLGVNGTVSLDSASATTTYINNNGATPGTDFSQLSANNTVSLAGTLNLNQGTSGGTCVALNHGDVATLFTTTGTLSGAFTNAANGAIITMNSSCQATAPQVQIQYTSHSVTATVVTGTTSTTTALATPSPSPAATNLPVKLTATVTSLTGSTPPSGTVAFDNNGSPIPGCASQAVSGSGTSATAKCTPSFAASTSPESLTAVFTGSSGFAGSSSSAHSLTVGRGSTTTSVAASNSSPGIGGSVTYTATVTPGRGGASKPSGTVQFLDAGKPIAGCASRPLTAGSSASTATCTVTYPSAGSHSVTAGYGGNANFLGSSSSALAVSVNTGRLLLPAGRLLVIGHTILVPEKCQSSLRCNGRFSITTTAHVGKNNKLGTVLCTTKFFNIKAHKKATVRARITGRCLALLKTKPHHRMAAKFTSRPRTGQLGLIKKITLALG